jgi:hypothetical protein
VGQGLILPQQAIKQSGFADIRPADQGHKGICIHKWTQKFSGLLLIC